MLKKYESDTSSENTRLWKIPSTSSVENLTKTIWSLHKVSRLFSCMNQFMSLLGSKLVESFITEATFMRFFTCMNQFMSFLVSKVSKRFVAVATFVRLFTCMNQFMFLFGSKPSECFIAVATLVRLFTRAARLTRK